VAIYGFLLLMPAVAFSLLVAALVRAPGQNAALAQVVGDDRKGKLSLLAYAVSIPIALIVPAVSVVIFTVVAAMWFVPDRRFEAAQAANRLHE
jgi:uncharacterized membrane protein